jgi:predicted GIY-YIG superfamily endonuclease
MKVIVKGTYDFELNFNVVEPTQYNKYGISGIYLFLNERKDLLYVGKTNDFKRRMNEHFRQKDGNTKHFIKDVKTVMFAEVVGDFDTIEVLEKLMIVKLKPMFNKKHTFKGTLSETKIKTIKYYLSNTSYTHKQISEIVGCARSTVSAIYSGKAHKQIKLDDNFIPEKLVLESY